MTLSLTDKARALVETACREDGLCSARIERDARNQRVVDLVFRHSCGQSEDTLAQGKDQLREFYVKYNPGKDSMIDKIVDEHRFERIMSAMLGKYHRAPEGWEQQLVINRYCAINRAPIACFLER